MRHPRRRLSRLRIGTSCCCRTRASACSRFPAGPTAGRPFPRFGRRWRCRRGAALTDRTTPVTPGLAAAYDAARAVWRTGDIAAAPLANNMLMDRDSAAWKRSISGVKAEVGDCPATEPITPISAMEGKFSLDLRPRPCHRPRPARADARASPSKRSILRRPSPEPHCDPNPATIVLDQR